MGNSRATAAVSLHRNEGGSNDASHPSGGDWLSLRDRALEAAESGIVIADALAPGFPIVYANSAFTRITGYVQGEANESLAAYLEGSDCAKADHLEAMEAIAKGHVCTVVVENQQAEGDPSWSEMTVSPVRDDLGRITHLIGVQNADRINAKKSFRKALAKLEERVRDRTEELERTNHDLEGFTYSVSHDLRSPLRAIMGFSKVLVEDYGTEVDSEMRRTLDRINGAAERMSHIIEDLLTFARLGRKEMIHLEVNLSEIAQAVATDLVRRHPDRNTVIDVDEGLVVEGDPTLLRMAIENLLDNAYKFTAKRDQGMVELKKIDEHKFVVRDNGAGFDPQYGEKLFRPFERLHSASEFPGTGIGLANVKRIIERHGGRIWAEGVPDKGASFYFEI